MIDTAEVIARIDLAALIAESVRLRKIPGNRWVGKCPFHNEKTDSFYVFEDEPHYHCFGCGAHGDAFTWIQQRDHVPFRQAAQDLAVRAGLDPAQKAAERVQVAPVPADPPYPEPFWPPVLAWGGQHLMRGGLPVIVLHDFPGRRLYLEIAELMDDHDVVWFPRLLSGLTAPAERMNLDPIALEAVWVAPSSDPWQQRRARTLERLIWRWRGYRVMGDTRRGAIGP